MRTIFRLCAVILALMLAATPALATSVAVLTNRNAKVYRSASASSASVSVPEGLEMSLTSYEDGWGKVSLRGKSGYIQMKYLNLKKRVAAYVSKDATLYADAGSNAVGKLARGTKVYLTGFSGDYAHVSDDDAQISGYIAMSALTSKKPAQLTGSQKKILRVIETAQSLIGRPYALNANPPSSFNCAAFVHYCFEAAESGVVDDTLGGQVHDTHFKKIKKISALKAGDIVCFNIDDSSDNIGHVGIYIGNGWFVHASSSDGEVTVSKLTSGYYKRTFSWGRRVFS